MSQGAGPDDDASTGWVTFAPAARGTDLFAAVEAAQYARVIDPVAAADADQAREIDALLELFYACGETWHEKSPIEQTALLEQFDHRLEVLDATGLRVHWAVPERSFITQEGESVTLPIALLKIRPADEPAPTAHVPLVLGVSDT